jgi:hypothetical protein
VPEVYWLNIFLLNNFSLVSQKIPFSLPAGLSAGFYSHVLPAAPGGGGNFIYSIFNAYAT